MKLILIASCHTIVRHLAANVYSVARSVTVSCVPQHDFADAMVMNMSEKLKEVPTPMHDGKGKGYKKDRKGGKGKSKDKDKGVLMPSGWLERCAALATCVADGDMERAQAWLEHFNRFDSLSDAMNRHRTRYQDSNLPYDP